MGEGLNFGRKPELAPIILEADPDQRFDGRGKKPVVVTLPTEAVEALRAMGTQVQESEPIDARPIQEPAGSYDIAPNQKSEEA